MGWLFLCYPLLAHLATLRHSQMLSALALLVLLTVPLAPGLRRGRPGPWAAWLGCALLLFWLARSGWAAVLAFAPPVLIPLAVMSAFAHSLRAGQEPLVTRIATLVRGGSLPPELAVHTRRVTQLWVLVLAALAVGAALLAWFASRETWSLATNFGMYLVMGALLLGEYGYRRWRYRHLPHEGLAGFIAGVARNRPRPGPSARA